MEFSRPNTGVGSLSLLQGIFSTQGLKPGLPHCRQILFQLTNHRRAETKIKKNSTLKPGKRRPQPGKSKLKKIMKKQRNTTQLKDQTRNTEVQINEEEIGKLPEKVFRIMIVKMIKNLRNKMEKMQESINKDLEIKE